MGKQTNGRASSIPLTSPANGGQIQDGVVEEFHDDVPSIDTQCGLGSWRPSFLQSCANVRAFTATLAFWSLFGNMNFTYYSAVITQIEKNYGLSSSMSGFIKNVDNIGYMLTVVLFSHFFRYSNKPRLFAAATLLSSSAIFLFATPHFFFGGSSEPPPILNGTYNTTMKRPTLTEFCASRTDDNAKEVCGGVGSLRTFNAAAFGIFIASELLQGVGQSPKFTMSMTYLDDNAKNKSPKYFAYMFSMRAFSPVMGFLLGAWTTSLYVDLSNPGFGPRDPRWVGAWWLGFVICAGLSVVWAFPMLLFPSNIEKKGKAKGKRAAPAPTAKELAKDLPRALVRLLKNRLYMMLVFAICVKIYMGGVMTFLPKYLEMHFGLTASSASIVTGATSAVSWAIGPIISGVLVSKLKLTTPFKSMKVIVSIMTFVVLGYLALFFMGCPQDKWAGDVKGGNLTLECNSQCSCEGTRFNPVCADGINYFSPCHAGCTGESKDNVTFATIYTGCNCVPSGQVTPGTCKKTCNMIYPYAAVYFISTLVASMAIIPTMSILMRCVTSKDKATSLAIATAIMQIVAFPAPMLAGAVIDSACLIQQTSSCSSRKGACWVYDGENFRYRMHGMIVVINLLALVFYFLGLVFSRNVEYQKDDDDEEEDVKDGAKQPMVDQQNGGTPRVANA